jgi:hypothetical protein
MMEKRAGSVPRLSRVLNWVNMDQARVDNIYDCSIKSYSMKEVREMRF